MVSQYLNTATTIVVALVVTPILARALGQTEFGVWVLVSTTVAYLELMEFGFAATTIKYVAEYHALGQPQRVRQAIATSFWILAIPGWAVLVLGVVLAAIFPLVFDVSSEVAAAARILILMQAVGLAASIPSDTFGGVLSALQRFDLLNTTLILVMVLQAVAWVLVLAGGGGLIALGLVAEVLSLSGQLARYFLCRRLVPGMSLSRRLFDRALVKPFAGLSVWFAMRDVARVVIFRLDAVVVGLVVGVPAAGVYAAGQKLALMAERLTFATMTMFFPHAAKLAADKDEEALRRTIFSGTRISLAVAGPLAVTLGVLSGPAIRAWVGSPFAAAAPVVVFLAATTALRAVNQTGLMAMHGMGKARVPAIIFSVEAAGNLALSLGLGKLMGIPGVALATLVAAVVTQFGLLLPYVCRELDLPLRGFVMTVARDHLPAVATSLLVGWVLSRAGVSGLVPVTLAGAAITGTYLLTLVFSALSTDERRRLVVTLRRLVPRRRPGPDAPA